MNIKLKTLRLECSSCPTLFEGETVEGECFQARLRYGYMKITLDNINVVECKPDGFEDVCEFEDFKTQAALRGFFIDDDEAEYSSSYSEMDKMIYEKVWVEFLVDFKASDKTYKKGELYTASFEIASLLVKEGLAIINDEYYEKKKQHLMEK